MCLQQAQEAHAVSMVNAACAERAHQISGCVSRTGAAYDYGEQKQRWSSARILQQHCWCLCMPLLRRVRQKSMLMLN